MSELDCPLLREQRKKIAKLKSELDCLRTRTWTDEIGHKWVLLKETWARGEKMEVLAAACIDRIGVIGRWTCGLDGVWRAFTVSTEKEKEIPRYGRDEDGRVPRNPPPFTSSPNHD